jgi:NitT/TauT family transport system ATP-binding protein
MSPRPGHIIDEVTIDIPQREDPFARRRDPRVEDYVTRLMERLGIRHPAEAARATA